MKERSIGLWQRSASFKACGQEILKFTTYNVSGIFLLNSHNMRLFVVLQFAESIGMLEIKNQQHSIKAAIEPSYFKIGLNFSLSLVYLSALIKICQVLIIKNHQPWRPLALRHLRI